MMTLAWRAARQKQVVRSMLNFFDSLHLEGQESQAHSDVALQSI
jgi:hypothetical protein